MLDSRKGMGIKTILVLALGLMTASTFMTMTTTGYFGKYFDQAFGKAENQTDYVVDIENKQDLSNLTHYVYTVASVKGCKEGITKGEPNWPSLPGYLQKTGGYKALEDSYLGKKPNCVGASETFIRGPGSWDLKESGYDMEGRFSRVKFEVTKPVTFVTYHDENNPDKGTWLERHLIAGSTQSYERAVITPKQCDKKWQGDEVNAADKAFFRAGVAGFFVPGVGTVESITAMATGELQDWTLSPRTIGTGPNYLVWFEDQVTRDRRLIDPVKKRQELITGRNTIYCSPSLAEDSFKKLADSLDFEKDQLYRFAFIARLYNLDTKNQPRAKVRLCPGDEGYIQVNQGGPFNDGEADRPGLGDQDIFPRIVVTNVETRQCGQLESGPAASIAYYGNYRFKYKGLTTYLTRFIGDEKDLYIDVRVKNDYWEGGLKVGAYEMNNNPLDVSGVKEIGQGDEKTFQIKINGGEISGNQLCRLKLKLLKARGGGTDKVIGSQTTVISLGSAVKSCPDKRSAGLTVSSSDVDSKKDRYVTLTPQISTNSYSSGSYYIEMYYKGRASPSARSPGYGYELVRRGESEEFYLTDEPLFAWKKLTSGSNSGTDTSLDQTTAIFTSQSFSYQKSCSVKLVLKNKNGEVVDTKWQNVRKSLKNCTP
ncbi:MAG: hypothetical protein ABEK01_03635 [Candidatus Nanohaloarchaea archaeon]